MSSVSVTNNSALTTGFFNSRFPQHVIPTGPFSTATERAQSIASAISMAASSNISYVYVPKQYTNYNASLISSDLTTSGVYLMVEGRGNALSAEAYGVDKTNDASRATENTVALQALLHAAPLGSEVELPDGVVVCNSTVTQHKRLRVSGQGPDSMLRFVQTNGSDGLVIGDGTATLDGWYLGNMAFSSESGAGSPWRLNCAHRGLAQNIQIPSAGSAGVHVAGSLLNTFISVNATTNHPYTYGTRRPPSYGAFVENGLIGTCAGNGSNGNTFIGCNMEGITSDAGVGYQLNSDANVIIGGATEGNDVGVGFGAGVHSNTLLNVYFEVNGSNVTYADATLGTNVLIQCVGGAFGTTNLANLAVGDGAVNLGGLHFTNDPGNGIFRIGSNSWALSTNSARLLELGATSISPYQSIIPDSSSAGTIDLGSSSLPFRSAYLSGISTKPLWMGAYALWVDATGDLRIKNGAPTSDGDGDVVGGQT
jgi:hypothetical protein